MRTVLITGGNRGIGRACAERFARSGHRVVITGRDRDALEKTVADLGAFGQVEPLAFDVTDEDAVAELVAPVAPDIVVANAGIAHSAPLRRTTTDDLQRILDINVKGVFLVARATVPGMVDRGWGRLVTVASVAGHHGLRYGTAYAASKHAAIGFTRSVAVEVTGTGVTANAVCPGFVDTEMTERSIANIVAATGRSEEEAKTALEHMNAHGRFVTADECAAAVEFLASDDAGSINGQSIIIDGGGLQQ